MIDRKPPGAIRFTFSYSEGDVRLDSLERVAMRPLPSHDLDSFEGRSGFWVELRDAQDRVVHRRVLHDPLRHEVEVFPEGGVGEFTRVPVARPAGTFDVVVPDLPGARELTLHASLPDPAPATETEADRAARISAGRGRPAQVIARIPIPAAPEAR
jgi:hypothetical protein